MVDISLVDGVINQLITGGVPHCRKYDDQNRIQWLHLYYLYWPLVI